MQRLAPKEVVGGIATRSYVAVMDEARRAALSTGVRQLLADHPGTRGRTPIELPYVTRAYRLTLAERAQGQYGRLATANTRRKGSTVVPSGRGG